MPLDLEPLELEPVGSKLDLEPLDLEPVSDPRAARRADLQAQQAAARSAGETTSFAARAAAGIEQGLRTPEVMVRGGLDALQYYRALDAVTGSGNRFQSQNEAELRAMRDRDAYLARETQAIEGRDGRNFVGDLVQGVARGVVELPPQLMAGAAGAMRGAAVQASAAMGGLQGGLSQYAQDRGEGRSQLEALPPAVASGLITAVTTRAFGDTGIESVFRNEGVQGFRRRLLGVLKDAGMEGAEEFVDQAQQDLLERATRNPGKPLGDSFYDTMQALGVGTVIGGAATAPRLIQRANRPVIVNEQTGTTDFPPLEGDELPPPPPPAPPAGPANVAPPIRGEAAMQTRPSAGWTPDGPRTPAVDPELAAAIAAIRAGYNPEVDAPAPAPAPPSTFNLQPSTFPEAPGVPAPLEGQPYEPGLLQRPEAAMETRRAAPLDLQREPAVSPELADAIAAVRAGYNPQVESEKPLAQSATEVKPSPAVKISSVPQEAWEIWAENLASDLDSFHPARDGGRDYDLIDTAQNFFDMARIEGGKTVWEAWTDFKAEYQGPQTHLRKIQTSLTEAGFKPSGKKTSPPPAPKTPPDQSGGPTELTPPAKADAAMSPMMQQYKSIKSQLPEGTLLAFRLGDFYEFFFEDAGQAAETLQVALTKRRDVPMAGIPYHMARSSFEKLVGSGYKVAVVDQVGEAKPGKPVERKVTEVISASQPTAPTELTPPAKGKRKAKAKPTDEYLNETVNYGGERMTRGQVIARMQSEGVAQSLIDRWLQGQETISKLKPAEGRPAEPGEAGSSQARKTALSSAYDTASRLAAGNPFDTGRTGRRLTELRETRPRPLDKYFGSKGGTPDERAAHEARIRQWNKEYRKAQAAHKLEVERSNDWLRSQPNPSAVDSAIAALEAAKVKPGGLYALPDLGLTVTLWNGTLTAAQLALRATRSLAQAVQAGVDWLRAQGQQFDEAKVRAALEQALPPELAGRANALKQMANPGVSSRAKEFIAPQVPYTRESRAEWQRAAQSWMATFDNPQWAAAEYWQMRDRLPGPVWVALGLNIAQQLNALETAARAAGRTAEADALGTLNGDFRANFVQVSTDVARTLNAYGMMSVVEEMGPFAADVFAQRTIEQASQKQKQRIKPVLDKGPDGEPGLTDRLNEINRTGIEEAARTPEVQGTARTVINQAIEQEARQAGTPIQQAIAAEVVAQLQTAGRLNAVEAAIVREHFGQNPEPLALADKLERAGVKPAKARAAELEGKYKDGVEAFRAKLRQKLTEARQKNIDPATLGIVDRAIRQRLAELQVKLGALVRQHWTQQERVGQTLAESLVNEAGLPEAQATRLADAIQRRFKALVQARKEKALRNLAKTPGARELQKPTVAQRIIEATNLGALDSEGLWQAVAEKLGLPTYTAEASAEVKRLADRAQQLPEGSVQRQEATARMMRFIARQKGINLGDLGWAFWYANTLSGPFTHAVNTFSNTLSLAANVATQLRDVRGIPQILVATAKGFRTGLTEARAIVKQGPGANRTKFTEQGQALENLDPQDFTGAGLVSQWRYVARALAAADAAFYFPAREAKAITLARALARQEGKTGAAIRTRAQQVIDGTEEQQNLWGAQVDRERAQLEAMGEQPDALWTTRRLEQLREQNWGADIGEAADDFALRTTYNNRPYGLVGALADVAKYAQRRVPGARAVVPFVNVVANVVNDSINYTPWGFARAYAASRTGEPSVTLSLPFEWAENLREGKSPMTPDAVVDLHAKAALGTVMVGSLMGLALAGLDDDDGENFQLYGAGPKDAAAKAALRETGWLPYSVRVNGTYLSFANTPLAIPLGALGHYLDAARYDKRFEQADAFNRLGVALWGGAHIITQQSFLDGLARLLGALEERRGRIDTASDRAVEQAFRSISSVAVPNALRQLDRLNDPKIYDTRGIEGALVAGIPFARRAGSPALNAFGEPITNEPWKRFASDAEANVWTDLARRKIYPSVADKAKNANGREMTDDEHYRYVQESGQAIKRRLETPGMRQMIRSGKEEDARKAVTAIVREERERTRRRLGF